MLFENDMSTIVSKGPLRKKFAFHESARVVQRKDEGFLIDPEERKYKMWEVLIVLVTCYTLIVTPFEVSFLPSDINVDGLFVMNLTIDIIFLTDTVLTFFIPYLDTTTGLVVSNKRRIAIRYLKFQFWVDFIPSIPYDLIAVIMLIATNQLSKPVEALKSLRVMRVLKTLRILRLMKMRKIFRKYHDRIPLRYATVTLIRYSIIMLLVSHWLACIFRLLPTVEQLMETRFSAAHESWITAYFVDGLGYEKDGYAVSSIYIAAFYWAVMTITTVGYGDVSAVTDFERIMVSVAMLVGAILYAYIVAGVCGIMMNLRRRDQEFFEKLDELDEYMRKENLPPYLRIKVRNYFFFSEKKRVFDQYQNLVHDLTPSLQEEISTFHNHKFLLKVPFVSCAPLDELNQFVIALSVQIQLEVYPPFEVLLRKNSKINNLFIVKSGSVLLHVSPRVELDDNDEPQDSTKRGNLYYRHSFTSSVKIHDGNCFGHEIILDKDIFANYFASALTYCQLYKLKKSALHEVLEEFYFRETRAEIKKFAKQFETDDTVGEIDGSFYPFFRSETSSSSAQSQDELNPARNDEAQRAEKKKDTRFGDFKTPPDTPASDHERPK